MTRCAQGLAAVTALAALACAEPVVAERCEGDGTLTTTFFVPNGHRVACANRVDFSFEWRTVALVQVLYGVPLGCTGGCIYPGHVCAIEDEGAAQLYYAHWFNGEYVSSGEPRDNYKPIGIDQLCPGVSDVDNMFWYTDRCEPPGRRHPLNDAPQFREFVIEGHHGIINNCLARFAGCYGATDSHGQPAECAPLDEQR